MPSTKINVALYGGYNPSSLFKTNKNNPCYAGVMRCDHASECSLHAKDQCAELNRSLYMSSNHCSFGHEDIIKGYSYRAKKYHTFRYKYEQDAKYNALHIVEKSCFFESVGDSWLIRIAYAGLVKDETTGEYQVDTSLRKYTFAIKKTDLTYDLFAELCSAKPRTYAGCIIPDYSRGVVPMLLKAVKNTAPDFYRELVDAHPELKKFFDDFNPVGLEAYTISLADGAVVKNVYGTFTKKGSKLICDNYQTDWGYGHIEVDIDPKSTTKITNRDQVSDDTQFIR